MVAFKKDAQLVEKLELASKRVPTNQHRLAIPFDTG